MNSSQRRLRLERLEERALLACLPADGCQVEETRVSAAFDDAEEDAYGDVSLGSSDLELVFDDNDQTVGMRFNGVDLPRGATILNSYVQFKVDETEDEPTSLVVQGEAVDNASPFVDVDYNISSRSTTAAFIPWSVPAWNNKRAAGEDQRTPDVAPVIQEIINRPGWEPGNPIVIIVTGSGKRVAESYDGDPAGAPLLHIEYTIDGGSSTNNPPVLDVIDDKVTDELVELSFTATASDPDGDSLTFSLGFGAPAGASIDSASGQFRWTPGEADGPGVFPITLVVTDDGQPNLSHGVTFEVQVVEDTPAFPGAEGYGAQSAGGRGGQVIEVTNLNDSGPGSLRSALEAVGPRIVVFRVAGIIQLLEPIRIEQSNSFVTVAGQTAPGGGITIRGTDSNLLQIQDGAHDVIIRYLRLRNGSGLPDGNGHDNLNLNGSHDVIIDHVSTSWATDENIGIYRGTEDPSISNISVQKSIISEGIDGHSNGVLVGGDANYTDPNNPIEAWRDVSDLSIHDNLFAHNSHRNPRVTSSGARSINNVIYNWEDRIGSTTRGSVFDFVNNYSEFGPIRLADLQADPEYYRNLTMHHEHQSDDGQELYPDPSIYAVGNIVEPDIHTDPSADNWDLWKLNHSDPKFEPLPLSFQRHTPLQSARFPVTVQTAYEAYDAVLADVGANARLDCLGYLVPNLDSVDARVITEVQTKSGPTSLISNPDEVGGYPTIDPGTPCADTDHDGMPDDWETLQGLDPSDPADGSLDLDGNGYTNIEEYLNSNLSPPNPANEAPVANGQSVATDEDTTLAITLTGSDEDGDPLTYSVVNLPTSGSLSGSTPNLNYTPDADFNGTDSFTFKVNDGTSNSNTATVWITVESVNDVPVVNDDAYSTAEDTVLDVTTPGVLVNDTDVDGDTLTAVLVSGPSSGSLSLNVNGSFSYTPNDNFHGSDSFTYTVNDGTSNSNTATVSITVNSVNDVPVFNDDSYSTSENTVLNVTTPGVLVNDTDVDGDTLTADLVSGPSSGTLTLNVDGSFTYTPNVNFNGTDFFTYTAFDGVVNSAPATVTIANSTAELSITNINPNTMDAGTSIQVTITGTGFQEGATVSLVNGIGPAPTVTVLSVSSDWMSIVAEFSVSKSGPKGTRIWDVVVTNPNDSTDTLFAGFEVIK